MGDPDVRFTSLEVLVLSCTELYRPQCRSVVVCLWTQWSSGFKCHLSAEGCAFICALQRANAWGLNAGNKTIYLTTAQLNCSGITRRSWLWVLMLPVTLPGRGMCLCAVWVLSFNVLFQHSVQNIVMKTLWHPAACHRSCYPFPHSKQGFATCLVFLFAEL